MQMKIYANWEEQKVYTEKEMKDFWEKEVTDLKTDNMAFDEWLNNDSDLTPSQIWEAMNNPNSKQIIEDMWLKECEDRVKYDLSEQWGEVSLNI